MVGICYKGQGGGIVVVGFGGEFDVLDLGADIGRLEMGVCHFAIPTFLSTFTKLHHSK